MPRYKDYNPKQTALLPISFEQQILPGTFEHTLVYLVDNKLLTSAIFNPPCNFRNPVENNR